MTLPTSLEAEAILCGSGFHANIVLILGQMVSPLPITVIVYRLPMQVLLISISCPVVNSGDTVLLYLQPHHPFSTLSVINGACVVESIYLPHVQLDLKLKSSSYFGDHQYCNVYTMQI